MTDCNTNQLVFSSLGRRKIQADFKGGHLTSDAGALLLREVDKRLGLVDAINNCIPFKHIIEAWLDQNRI